MPKVSKNQLDLAVMIGANIHLVSEDVAAYFTKNENRSQIASALEKGFIIPELQVQDNPVAKIDFRGAGKTFGDWLKARETLHMILTGEVIVLRDMFEIPDELLSRTDIVPFFRPAGATNRMAMEWKVKLGMKESYEEVDVMKYKNSKGSQIPELGFIRRSTRPDEGTFNKSPNQLVKLEMKENQKWLNLFGYADADNLLFLVTGEHLDPETWTWFVNDQLPGDCVACGCWDPGCSRSEFGWNGPESCFPDMGARLAEFFSLKS